jgi:hypothetical protein
METKTKLNIKTAVFRQRGNTLYWMFWMISQEDFDVIKINLYHYNLIKQTSHHNSLDIK